MAKALQTAWVEPAAPSTPKRGSVARPNWWLHEVARETHAHRETRARQLEDAGRERGLEAVWVVEQLRKQGDAERWFRIEAHLSEEELAEYWTPPDRELADWRSTNDDELELARVLRRWDNALAAQSLGARRLFRELGESHASWLDRVKLEALRRVESKWHAQRADGQRTRFARVRSCGTESRGWVTCADCGHSAVELKKWCNNHWACPGCRERRKNKYRTRIRSARAAYLEHLRQQRMLRGQRHDPFEERFLTLTLPHSFEPAVACKLIREGWRKFWQRLRAFIKRHHGKRAAELTKVIRVVEATPGNDGKGHIHIHAWWVGPFVRVELVRVMWGRALLSAMAAEGIAEDSLPETAFVEKSEFLSAIPCELTRRALRYRTPHRIFAPVVDLQKIRGKRVQATGYVKQADGTLRLAREGELRDLADELVKYITKDLSAGGLIDPRLWARIYEGLAEGRMITASHGFWIRVVGVCPCCQARHPWTITSPAPDKRDTSERGPPQLTLA